MKWKETKESGERMSWIDEEERREERTGRRSSGCGAVRAKSENAATPRELMNSPTSTHRSPHRARPSAEDMPRCPAAM